MSGARPHPEFTAIHIAELDERYIHRSRHGDGLEVVTTLQAAYVTPSAGRKPLSASQDGRWEIRRVMLMDGVRVDFSTMRVDDLAEAKLRVEWMVAFWSHAYRGDFNQYRREMAP